MRRRRRSLAGLALAAGAVSCGAAVAFTSLPGAAERDPAGASAPLPPPARPFAVPAPRALDAGGVPARWAPLARAAVARAAPRAEAPAVQRVPLLTPEGTQNLVLVLGGSRATADGVWVRARLPGVRAASGWLPRAALGGYTLVRTRLVVDRARLRATLYEDGRSVFSAPVAVGRADAPTPAGDFYVRDKLTRYSSAVYGPLAFGTSALAPGVTDWPAGGFVGIHGTDEPGLVPGRVSHGCIRLRNADIVRLGRLMPVGTPLRIS